MNMKRNGKGNSKTPALSGLRLRCAVLVPSEDVCIFPLSPFLTVGSEGV